MRSSTVGDISPLLPLSFVGSRSLFYYELVKCTGGIINFFGERSTVLLMASIVFFLKGFELFCEFSLSQQTDVMGPIIILIQ